MDLSRRTLLGMVPVGVGGLLAGVPEVRAGDPASAGEASVRLETFRGLRRAPAEPGHVVLLSGYYRPGDGYGGVFLFDPEATTPDDGHDTIRPDAVDPGERGRYRRLRRAQRDGPPRAVAVSASSAPDVQPLDAFGGYLWGTDGEAVYRSTDGESWQRYAPGPDAGVAPVRLLETADREVLVVCSSQRALYKSQGWGDGEEIRWQQVLDLEAWGQLPGGVTRETLDGSGDRFVAANHAPGWDGQPWNRRVWISTDSGESWALRYDAHHTDGAHSGGQARAVAYDPWGDAFYLLEGRAGGGRLYRSPDAGQSWDVVLDEEALRGAPSALAATPAGLLIAGDARTWRGIARLAREHATDAEGASAGLSLVYEIRDPDLLQGAEEGVVGQVSWTFADPRTGAVFFGWAPGRGGRAFVTACDGEQATLVATAPADAVNGEAGASVRHVFVTPADVLRFRVDDGQGEVLAHVRAPLGYGVAEELDRGRLWGGNAHALPAMHNSVAVGPHSVAQGIRSLAVGEQAVAGPDGAEPPQAGRGQVAIGFGSRAVGGASVSIGEGALATGEANTVVGHTARVEQDGEGHVVIGVGALAAGRHAVCLGRSARAARDSVVIGPAARGGEAAASVLIGAGAAAVGGEDSMVQVGANTQAGQAAVAIGRHAAAEQPRGVALGFDADASGSEGTVAIGHDARVGEGHERSVALGAGAETKRSESVSFGDRDLELTGEARGFYLRSPAGKVFHAVVNDDGQWHIERAWQPGE